MNKLIIVTAALAIAIAIGLLVPLPESGSSRRQAELIAQVEPLALPAIHHGRGRVLDPTDVLALELIDQIQWVTRPDQAIHCSMRAHLGMAPRKVDAVLSACLVPLGLPLNTSLIRICGKIAWLNQRSFSIGSLEQRRRYKDSVGKRLIADKMGLWL